MAKRKVYVQIIGSIVIEIDDDIETDVISKVIQEMDCTFKSNTDKTNIVDSEICEHEITKADC